MEDNKTKSIHNADILYVNKLTNTLYIDGDILETNISRAKNDLPRDTIFDIFARIITKNGEQRKVLYHLLFDKAEYNKSTLCKKLSVLYGKSSRTYERALDYLYGKRIIYNDRNKIIHVALDYDLSLLDLENVKSVIIHIG